MISEGRIYSTFLGRDKDRHCVAHYGARWQQGVLFFLILKEKDIEFEKISG
jgi:hypothetical protein